MGTVTWRAYTVVKEIDLNNREMVAQMEELMK
jgi:hypothetical protein